MIMTAVDNGKNIITRQSPKSIKALLSQKTCNECEELGPL